MKAEVDKGKCIACGLCVEICPEVFRMGEDGFSEAYTEVSPENEEQTDEAVESCPVDAIVWIEK